MINSSSLILPMYFVLTFFFFNFTNPYIFWIFTELNLLLFIMLIFLYSQTSLKQEVYDSSFFYFVIQSMASIFLLSNFFFSLDFFIFNPDYMFLISTFIKLGIYPFFFWIFKISNFLSSIPLTFLLTLQKVPIFCLLFSSLNIYMMSFILFSFISGSLLMLFSGSFIHLLVASSVSSSFWIFYIYNISLFFFLIYYFFYTVLLFFLLLFMTSGKSSSSIWISIFFFTFLLGLPPLSLFFFKFYLAGYLFLFLGPVEVLVFWVFSFVSLFGYMKFSLKSFFFCSDMYYFLEKMKISSSFFLFSLIFFFFFLI